MRARRVRDDVDADVDGGYRCARDAARQSVVAGMSTVEAGTRGVAGQRDFEGCDVDKGRGQRGVLSDIDVGGHRLTTAHCVGTPPDDGSAIITRPQGE